MAEFSKGIAEKLIPLDLERFLKSKVSIRVKDGRQLLGVLTQYDDHMNLLLEDVEEYVGEKLIDRYKMMVVKGGNIQAIYLITNLPSKQ